MQKNNMEAFRYIKNVLFAIYYINSTNIDRLFSESALDDLWDLDVH